MHLRYMRIVSVLAPQVNDQPGPGHIDILNYFKLSFNRFLTSLDRCTNKYVVKFKFFATTCKSHRYCNFYDFFSDSVKHPAQKMRGLYMEVFMHPSFAICTGFVEKEIKKANIPIVDTGENPEVPFPRDMIDLEVTVGFTLPINHKVYDLLLNRSF